MRRTPSKDRTVSTASKQRRRPVRSEPLEGRVLLSSYSLSTLGVFGTNATGANPNSGVVMDAGGNLYGTTEVGGASGAGAVFEIAAGSGTITNLASFNRTNGAEPSGGVVLDSSGNLYGTTTLGGASGDGTVFEIAHGSGTITTLATFNFANGANPQWGVVLDSSGNLYGTTYDGGAGGNGTVFEIAAGSGTITPLASFNGTKGAYPNSLVLDGSGNLYGTAGGGGTSGGGTVFEIAAGSAAITTLASFDGDNGENPTGVVLDGSGNVYGTTEYGGDSTGYTSSGTVFEIAHGSETITTLATFKNTNGADPHAGVVLDGSGNLYGTTFANTDFVTADNARHPTGDGTVFEVAHGSRTITILASFKGTDGSNPQGGVVMDGSGNLYGTTYYSGASDAGTVFEIAHGSGTITTIASFNGTNGSGPGGVVLDGSGNLYGITSTTYRGGISGNGTVFEVAAGSGTIATLASFDSSTLTNHSGEALDGSGNLYATTIGGGVSGFTGSHIGTVFELAAGSGAITTLVSFDGTNGSQPNGVVLDGSGNLYGTTQYGGANLYYGTVFEIAAGSGTITTLASFDGTNGGSPRAGVALDSSGNLYGTTSGSGATGYFGTVFEIAAGSGTITTLATFNGTNGSGPSGVVLDGGGNLYGTTFRGGDANGDGTVFEVAAGSGTITNLASFNRTNGANPLAGVVLDSSGNLYGTTEGGGDANGDGTVFEIAHGSGTITTIASFNGTNGSNPEAGVVLDGSGNLYGTTFSPGGNGDGTVFELSPVKPHLPADFNGDGKQDFADLLILAQNYGKTGVTFAQGDANGDGAVGFDDLLILAQNYGSTALAGADKTAAATSSPASQLLDQKHQRRARRPSATPYSLVSLDAPTQTVSLR